MKFPPKIRKLAQTIIDMWSFTAALIIYILVNIYVYFKEKVEGNE